jgi:HEAT repeat protein
VVPRLLAAYDAGDIESRLLYLEVIESIGEPSIVRRLLDIAFGLEPRTAEAAVRALAKVGAADAVRPLIELIRRSEPELGRQAALALASIGLRAPDAVASRLREVMAGGDLRPAWVSVLGVLGRGDDAAVVRNACHDRDPEVRRAAIEALASFEGESEEPLIMALADENLRVRAAAARALGAFRSERVVDVLLVAARDSDPWVVAEALRSLGSVGGPRAGLTLATAAGASSSPIAIAALQSLFRLNPSSLAEAVSRAMSHVDPEVVREALVTSMRLPVEAALPLLREALKHRFWHVRLAAAETVAKRGISLPQEEVRDRVQQENEPLVREALARLLESLRARR